MSTVLARIAAAAAATLIAVAPGPAAHATEPSALKCHYTFTAWPGGFSADLSIANSGPAIDGWTVQWTFATPTLVNTFWLGRFNQAGPHEIVVTPMPWNEKIPTGSAVAFGWTATASATEVPTDITVNGIPC